MEFHPAANIFPLDDGHLDDLAEDIKTNGQQKPIEIFEGKILDGRRRSRACELAGVDPVAVDVAPDDPVFHVLQANDGRTLTIQQAAIVAARIVDLPAHLRTEATKRTQLTEILSISLRTIEKASRLLRHNQPLLLEHVAAGRLTIGTADRIASATDSQQNELLEKELGQPHKSKLVTITCPHQQRSPPQASQRERRSTGLARAHEAIATLKRIPLHDPLRQSGLSVVYDWIRSNRKVRNAKP